MSYTGGGSTSLYTDAYELTMVDAALGSGHADCPAVFEVFARRLPPGRRFGVVAGTARLADAIARFRFTDHHLEWLGGRQLVDRTTLKWLEAYRFHGTIRSYREGELFFPGSPVLTVEGTFAEALVLETIVLSILNHDSAIASAATRMVAVACGRPIIEMGSRRTHEEAAVAAARAAYLAGFASTSNLEAGRRFGIPVAGTAAHAFTLAHADEKEAFTAQVDALGPGTTLLVDTYDIPTGVRTAVEVAGPTLGAVRIDSGDLAEEARRVRRLLDQLGASKTRIVASGDLDEYSIDELASAPIDGYGVGSRVVGGSGHPTANFIYKLVAIGDRPGGSLRPVAKRSVAKATVGGRKTTWRILDGRGRAVGERASVTAEGDDPLPPAAPARGRARALQVALMSGGEAAPGPTLEESRAYHRLVLDEVDGRDRSPVAGPPLFELTVDAARVDPARVDPA